MGKVKFIFPILFLIFSIALKAQPNNEIEISCGKTFGMLKDLNYSPLGYNECGILLGVNYTHKKPNGKEIFEANINFNTGILKTIVSDYFTSVYLTPDINFAFLRKLAFSKNKKFSFYLGVQYQSKVQFVSWNNSVAFSFAGNHGLGIKGLANYNFNKKHSVQTSLAFPILCIVVRPPYNGNDDYITANEDNILKIGFYGNIASVNKLFAVTWQTNYKYNLSKRFGANIRYGLDFKQFTDLNKYIHIQNLFSIGLSYKF